MDLITKILIILQFIGLAAVFGGFWHQLNEKQHNITQGMFQGGVIQLVAMAGMVLIAVSKDEEMTSLKIALIVISVLIAAVTYYFRGKKSSDSLPWLAAGILPVLFVALPLFWS